jgi:glutamyl/glutaminyl-tRNA synthetase
LHLGNAYSFALTAALAKRHSARLMLRIDDMDRQRAEPAYIEDVFNSLRYLQIDYADGPRNAIELKEQFSQWIRLPLYEAALMKLANDQKVYACRCSRSASLASRAAGCPNNCRAADLALDEPGVAWRLITDEALPLKMKSYLCESRPVILPPDMKDFVVRKKDGMPAYQLCSLVDDLHFGVDLIVRGLDLWASSIAQIYLATVMQRFDFTESTFFHHPLLIDSAGQKLSKSAGATSLQFLHHQGVTQAELYATLGELSGSASPVTSFADLPIP